GVGSGRRSREGVVHRSGLGSSADDATGGETDYLRSVGYAEATSIDGKVAAASRKEMAALPRGELAPQAAAATSRDERGAEMASSTSATWVSVTSFVGRACSRCASRATSASDSNPIRR